MAFRGRISIISLSLCLLASVKICKVQSYQPFTSENLAYKVILDSLTELSLEWRVDRVNRSIILAIEGRFNGTILFGFTKFGELEGADVIATGMGKNEAPYLHDMYITNQGNLTYGEIQDWQLLGGQRTSHGRTIIRIQRMLDTCDEKDLPIGSELVHVLWSNQPNHRVPSRFDIKGVQKIYFQDHFMLPQSEIRNDAVENVWRLTRKFRLLPKRTSYWCSMHKMRPSLTSKHHIIGFQPYHRDAISRRHVHHQILYRCSVPRGLDPVNVFEPFLQHPGEECYLNIEPELPVPFCREMIYIDAVGAEPTRFPSEVGLALGESPNEYFMLEVHYDNQDLDEFEVEAGADILYSPNLRKDEGSIIFVGHNTLGLFIQPPKTSDFTIVGHCSKECTNSMLQSEGSVNVVGIALHAHMSSRRMRLRHYRGNKQLQDIINDRRFDFNYQNMRLLETPVSILPGDQITAECGYDNRWLNGSAVVSGFSTRDEMCMGFLLLTKRLQYSFCASELPGEQLLERFGIHNVTWDDDMAQRIIDSADNSDLVGLTLSQAIERFANWTPEEVADLERFQMFNSHRAGCPNFIDIAQAFSRMFQSLPEDSEELVRSVDQIPLNSLPPPTVSFPSNITELIEPACGQNGLQPSTLVSILNSSPKPDLPLKIKFKQMGTKMTPTSFKKLPAFLLAPNFAK